MDLQSLMSGISSSYTSTANTMTGIMIWTIIAAILAITGAILVYFLFVKSKADFKGFAKNLRDYLSFKTMHVEALIKMFYYAFVIYYVLTSINNLITYCSVGMVAQGLISFFEQLLLYPLVLRLIFELLMVLCRIWRNTDKLAEKK
ncbi:hypothetical protein IJ162_00900 [Candidatus Saccharibacteria bacterium]|nr:hypothetical protein [Candidatus Saccharibacteria bacterium]